MDDLFLESGCVTFAEVLGDGARPSSIDIWRLCRQEGQWRQLPDDTYIFSGLGLCAEYNPEISDDQSRRCIDASCNQYSKCFLFTEDKDGRTEETFCKSHANGSAGGIK